jgi:hypothetical protein
MSETSNALIARLQAKARQYAEGHLRQQGHIPPTLLCETADKEIMLVLAELENELDNQFGSLARMTCIANTVLGAVFVAQARMVEDSSGMSAGTQSNASAHRGQYVLISVETPGVTVWQRLVPILRADTGTFLGLGEAETPLPESIQRKLPQFLPLTQPSETRRELARVFLEMVRLPTSCIRFIGVKR